MLARIDTHVGAVPIQSVRLVERDLMISAVERIFPRIAQDYHGTYCIYTKCLSQSSAIDAIPMSEESYLKLKEATEQVRILWRYTTWEGLQETGGMVPIEHPLVGVVFGPTSEPQILKQECSNIASWVSFF
jgi:hypothetical protein